MDNPKDILRQEAKRHRSRVVVDPAGIESAKELFLTAIRPQPGQVVSGYWTKGREIDAVAILEHLFKNGFTCALPVMQKDTKELAFVEWHPSDALEEGPYGIMQPAPQSDRKLVEPDIVIVPLLAFDRKGHRLGYGGGYFDTTLKSLRARKKITAVGLAYAEQACLFNLPAEPHDETLDWVITPQDSHYYGD